MFGELEDSDIYVNNQNESFEEVPDADAYAHQEAPVPGVKKDSENGKLMIYVIVLVFVMIAAGGFYIYQMKADEAANTIVSTEEQQNAQEMGDYFYDKAKSSEPQTATGAAADTAVVDVDLSAPASDAPNAKTPVQPAVQPGVKTTKADKEKKASEKTAAADAKAKEASNLTAAANKPVVIPVTNGGRANPFLPYQKEIVVANMPQFDIIAPPMDIPEIDPLTDTMMSTKISGIMFDGIRPSAIINFDGTDHLVHKGDKVKGYIIVDITKDRVVMKNGTNIYRASVGQEIDDSVKFNEVSNLNHQFGGAYGRSANIIEIKGK